MTNYYFTLTVFTLHTNRGQNVPAKSIRINMFRQVLADVTPTELINSLHDRKVGGASMQPFPTW